jgi:hypothetical protein
VNHGFASSRKGYDPPMLHRSRFIVPVLLVSSSLLIAAGCGSGTPDIAETRTCLEKLNLTVEDPPAKDNEVKEGVFATTDLTKAAEGEFTFAMAAIVKDEGSVKTFEDEAKKLADAIAEDDKIKVETGTDGTYVWVAGGADDKAIKSVRGCVEP